MSLPPGWLGPEKNFLGIPEPWCHPDQAGVYVLSAPYEHTSSYVKGSDRGPSAILEASHQVELYDETLDAETYGEWGGVATTAPLDLDGRIDRAAVEAIEHFVGPRTKNGHFLVTLTGDTPRSSRGVCPVRPLRTHVQLRQGLRPRPLRHSGSLPPGGAL